ncbi:hypothetical protein [Actinomadura fibrosa]|uniref:Protein kinase domain-containing protein n=1 Tax=Actinomadura fibrosa TaxID=111802 RepID=A0ABW2XCP4_9ACTN|nr:hypothetical protein [Actinomadura fibrosa]
MQSPASRTPAPAPLEPGDPALIGGYRVLARLGGSGRTYLATTQSGRRLAITRFPARYADDPALRRGLKARIAAAQRARSPFLAAVVDGHADESGAWAAAEYAPGPSLEDAITETGPLPVAAVRALVGALARALQAVHEADHALGDLSPSRVFLTEDGPRVSALGQPGEEPPASRAGDVLRLGRVALFAATGREDFPEPSPAGEPEPPGCPDELRGLVERCLADDPGERPEPSAVIAALEEEPPAEGWLPPDIAALLPAYLAEPPARGDDPAADKATPSEAAEPPGNAASKAAPVTAPDLVPASGERAAARQRPVLLPPAGPPPPPGRHAFASRHGTAPQVLRGAAPAGGPSAPPAGGAALVAALGVAGLAIVAFAVFLLLLS